MRLTRGGQALIALFAVALVLFGAYASSWSRAEQPTQLQFTPGEDVRLGLLRAAGVIEALDAEIVATDAALDVARKESAARTFSRKDDRDRVADLNMQVVRLRAKRAQAVREYDAGVAAVGSSMAAGLPVFRQAGS